MVATALDVFYLSRIAAKLQWVTLLKDRNRRMVACLSEHQNFCPPHNSDEMLRVMVLNKCKLFDVDVLSRCRIYN